MTRKDGSGEGQNINLCLLSIAVDLACFTGNIHSRSPILYLISLKYHFFNSLKFSFVLIIYLFL